MPSVALRHPPFVELFIMLIRNPVFILTHLLFIVTMMMGFTVSSVNAALAHAIQPASFQAQEEAKAISDMMILAWSAGGNLLGAYIGIAQAILMSSKESGSHVPLPKSTDTLRNGKIVMAFSVSLLIGILVTPAIVSTDWMPDKPFFIFALGGLISYAAWAILYVVNKVSSHFMRRAEKEGGSGVIDEAKKIAGS